MTRLLRILVVIALVGPWVAAAAAWPELPERFPIHFDLAGRPDGWADRSSFAWFILPAVASALGALLGLGLPWFAVVMARANSNWLNVPNRARFRELPEEARVSAVAAPASWLGVLAIEVQVLFVWLLRGIHAVGTGQRQTLSVVPLPVLIGLFVATVIAFVVHSHRAVAKECERVRKAQQ